MNHPETVQQHMAPTTTQPIRPRSQPEASIPPTGPSLPPPRIAQSQGSEARRGTGETNNATQPAGNSVSSNQKLFWSDTFPKIINVCGALGLLLALIFGITQWVAQDKSIAIAKESELVTLALSCSDEKIKYTSICQQFLDKYPNGPAISRRGNVSVDNSHHQDPKEVIDLQYTPILLAMMDRFLQEQNSRFQLALNTRDPKESLARTREIAEAGNAFLQNMISLKTALALQRVENNSDTVTTYSYTPPTWMIVWGICFVMACLLLIHTVEFSLLLGLLILYRCQEYYWRVMAGINRH